MAFQMDTRNIASLQSRLLFAVMLEINMNSSPPGKKAGQFRLHGEQMFLSVVASDGGTDTSH